MQDPLIDLDTLCGKWNQATEHRNLPGRFATITVLALDGATGQLWVTSRGNSLIPILHKDGSIEAGPDFLLSRLRAVYARGNLKMPAKEGRERPSLDLSALPGDMALTERMSVALLALRLHDLANRCTPADTEEQPHTATLYIRRSHAEILGKMFPDFETQPHTDTVSKLPIVLYDGFQSPVAFTLRYTGAPG